MLPNCFLCGQTTYDDTHEIGSQADGCEGYCKRCDVYSKGPQHNRRFERVNLVYKIGDKIVANVNIYDVITWVSDPYCVDIAQYGQNMVNTIVLLDYVRKWIDYSSYLVIEIDAS